MEFLDEDARPRFLFQSKAVTSSSTDSEPQNLSKPLIAVTVIVSLGLLALAFFFLQSEPYQSLLIWVALSILVGPFAPPSVTGGDIRVGRGAIVEFPEVSGEAEEEARKRASQKRQKPRRGEDSGVDLAPAAGNGDGFVKEERKVESLGVRVLEEEGDWGEEDVEVLKKQMAKNPVGKPRRWEVIAEGLGGRYKVESVIKKAKELGEKKVSDSDSYAEFLRKRKPNEKKNEELAVGEEEGNVDGRNGVGGGGESWGASEDIALLNALKAFPKEVSMRWEKIAAAVPGKTKAACVKRVGELKKGFRSAKAATEE